MERELNVTKIRNIGKSSTMFQTAAGATFERCILSEVGGRRCPAIAAVTGQLGRTLRDRVGT